MPMFLNHYDCPRCGKSWSDEWSATCDDDCPHCGCRHVSPTNSDDLDDDGNVIETVITDQWQRDSDNWLVRKLRPTDPTEAYWAESCHGFICDGAVYAREQEHADAFDKAGHHG